MKKLYKNSSEGKICGVCAGLAEYLNLDVTVVRILWILFIALGGSGILIYFICALVMPDKRDLYY